VALEASDEQLLRRAARPDGRQAFALLVNRHQSELRGSLRRLTRGNAALADDLAQEAFIRAWRALGDFRGESSFRTWLYRIAYRCFLSELRRGDPQTAELGEWDATADDTAGAGAFMRDFERAMAALAPAQRDAVHLALARGFSHPEIADIMALPIGTVKTHVLRGRQKLQQLLGDWEEGFGDDT